MRTAGSGNYAECANRIKQLIPTVALCQQVGLQLDRNGNAFCPFHDDRKGKSLKVYADTARGWHCFGCGLGGTVIDFAMQWYGINFRQAVLRLDSDFGLALPIGQKQTHERRMLAIENARKNALMRKREQIHVRELENAYYALLGCFLTVWQITRANRPKQQQDEISDVYANALWQLPILREACAEAYEAWIMCKERRNTQSYAAADPS